MGRKTARPTEPAPKKSHGKSVKADSLDDANEPPKQFYYVKSLGFVDALLEIKANIEARRASRKRELVEKNR
jgi:hypothetical protein